MSNLKFNPPATYEGWRGLVDAKTYAPRKVAHNTTAYKWGDDVRVVYHETCIATIHPNNSVTLNNGGWQTFTTLLRLNRILYALTGLHVSQKDFVWYVSDYATGVRVPYANGVAWRKPLEIS